VYRGVVHIYGTTDEFGDIETFGVVLKSLELYRNSAVSVSVDLGYGLKI